jgi:hypothetical protein
VGPIALFDKSFLQSLTVDESVWFGHFFMPVVCPLFFVETLADLEKDVRGTRTPEQEVRIVAEKFPDQSAKPCAFHGTILVHDLMGNHTPLDGRIPLPGGTPVTKGDEAGYTFDQPPEMQAFSRWQKEEFRSIEREYARGWREQLNAIDLKALIPQFQSIGIDARTCKSLEQAHAGAASLVATRGKHFQIAQLLGLFAGISRMLEHDILERWSIAGYRPLTEHAPYAAHVLSVELFFQIALASGHIGSARPSNRVDIGYLNYLPFCQLFVSSDRLHERCAPLFLRDNQRFVWGPELKQDLGRIDAHFKTFPEAERDRGISAFAHAPPKVEGSIVRNLRAQFLGPGYDDQPFIPPPEKGSPAHDKIMASVEGWQKSENAAARMYDSEFVSISYKVHKRRGSWWQLPKDMQPSTD